MRRVVLVCAFGIALWCAAPASALPVTFCVGQDPGGGFPGCAGTPETSISNAIAAAPSGGTTIEIGPGTYDEMPVDPSTKAITIVGSGVGQTVVQPSGTANAVTTFTINNGGTSLSGLTVGLENGTANLGVETAGSLSNIDVTSGSGATGPGGVVFTSSSSSLSDAAIIVPGVSGTGVSFSAGGGTISHVRVTASEGIYADAAVSGTLTVDDVLFVASPGSTYGFAVRADSGDIFGAETFDVTVRHLTAYGDGNTSSEGIQANATAHASTAVTNLQVDSSIIRNVGHAIVAFTESTGGTPTSDVSIDYSDLDTSGDSITGTGGASISAGAHNINQDPQFASTPSSAASDATGYHLSTGSPAIDAGDPAPLAAGEPTTDLDGSPRVQAGHNGGPAIADMGAFEYTPHPPAAVASATPSSVVAGSPATFSASGSSDPDPGDTLSYVWHFDDGASASGASVSHAFATTGSHSGTVTVTDRDGFSTSATATVTVIGPGRDSKVKISPSNPKRGQSATVRYRDSMAEASRFTVQLIVPGVRRGHACVKAALDHHKRCNRYVKVSGFSHTDAAGANRVRLHGRRLKAGRYRLTVQTVLGGVLGPAVYVTFRVM